MEVAPTTLDPYLQRQVDHGVSGIDIMHGHLKVLMLEAEQSLEKCIEIEEESGEAMDSMDRTYFEGQLDILAAMYSLTYDLSFAIMARKANERE